MGASVVGLSVGELVGYLVGILVGETVGLKVVRTSVLEADDVTGARVGDEPSLAVSAPPSVSSSLKALKDIRRLLRSFASCRTPWLSCEASTCTRSKIGAISFSMAVVFFFCSKRKSNEGELARKSARAPLYVVGWR